MKDRIAQIMKSEKMTQQDFAAALDISPSTLSSIFNDRTQPSLTIVYKIHDRFPAINLMWLLYGQGDMYSNSENKPLNPDVSNSLPGEELPGSHGKLAGIGHETSSPDLFGKNTEETTEPVKERIIERVKYIDKPARRITEINVYFDDGTYEVFVPRKKD